MRSALMAVDLSYDARARLVADCGPARAIFEATGAQSFMDCYHIANQLHMWGHFIAASKFYRICHDISENKHMLHTQLLCEIKAGQRPSIEDMAMLRSLDFTFHDYILGVEKLSQPLCNLADYRQTIPTRLNLSNPLCSEPGWQARPGGIDLPPDSVAILGVAGAEIAG